MEGRHLREKNIQKDLQHVSHSASLSSSLHLDQEFLSSIKIRKQDWAMAGTDEFLLV